MKMSEKWNAKKKRHSEFVALKFNEYLWRKFGEAKETEVI